MIIDTVYNEDGEFVREEPTEMTNEERIRTCSTEELATMIYGIAVYDTLYDRIINIANPLYDDGTAGVKVVLEWLKEKIVPTEPQTEQEYLQTCTTEQLAEEIVNMTLLDRYKLYDQMESAEYEHGIGIGAKKVIVEWLKQPHTPKE